MTKPTITYGHGKLEDCQTAYTTRGDSADSLTNMSCTVQNDSWFKIKGDTNNLTALEWCYYQSADLTSEAKSTSVYDKWLLRYRTSVSSLGLGAKVVVVDTDDVPETIYGSTPQYSTEWKVVSGTFETVTEDLKYIRFYAAEDAVDNPNGTYWVEYDFLLIHSGTFTFPNCAEGFDFSPPPRYAIIPIFGRVGDITQGGGSESAVVHCSCNLDIGTETYGDETRSKWMRPQGIQNKTDYVKAEVFYDIAHNSYREAWQWLTTGETQFKATMETPVFRHPVSGGKTSHILDLTFREYRAGCASNEQYYERFGLNL